jgi:hypothetical protein
MTNQPDTPVPPATPAAGTETPPPSRYLNQGDAGMVSQADVQDDRDQQSERERRENINPSLAREEPADTDAAESGALGNPNN